MLLFAVFISLYCMLILLNCNLIFFELFGAVGSFSLTAIIVLGPVTLSGTDEQI